MRKQRESSSISNRALAAVLGLFVVTLGVFGVLFYDLKHSAHTASVAGEDPQPVVSHESAAAAKTPDAPIVVSAIPSNEDAPVIGLAPRALQVQPAAAPIPHAEPVPPPKRIDPPAPVSAPVVATTKDVVAEPPPAVSAPVRAPAMPAPNTAKDSNSNEMVPDIKGPSYTAKKAQSIAADPSAAMPTRPNKPNPKKPVPPVTATKPPVPANPPAKPDAPKPAVAKSDPPKAPALPPLDTSMIDLSKVPVYVLNDGRRIRALSVRDDNGTITVKNEVGTDITFKKSDVKEILRG